MARTQSTQPTPPASDTEADNPTTTTTPETTSPPPDQGGDVPDIKGCVALGLNPYAEQTTKAKSSDNLQGEDDAILPDAPPSRLDVAIRVCCALLSHGRYAGSLSEQDLAVLRDRAYAIADAMLTPPDPA